MNKNGKKSWKFLKRLRPTKAALLPGKPGLSGQKDNEDYLVADKKAGTFQLISWLVRIARPVLKPLYLSSVSSLLNQGLGIALVAFGGYRVSFAALTVATGGALPLSYLWITVGVMALLAALKGLFRYLEQFAGHYVAFKALELLRSEMYRALVPQAPALMVEAKSGDLLTRVTSDIDRIEVFFAHTLVPAFTALVIPLGVSVFTGVMVNPLSGFLLFLIYLANLMVLLLLGTGEGNRGADLAAKGKGQVAQTVTDSVNGINEVVGYGLQRIRIIQLERYMSIVSATSRVVNSLFAVRRAFTQTLMYLALLLIMLVAAPASSSFDTLPSLVAVLFAVLRSWDVCRSVEDFSTNLANSFAAARRVWTLAHTPPQVRGGVKELEEKPFPIIFKDVSFSYPQKGERVGAAPVVQEVSFSVPAGSWTSICGATGSGKSTLASLLLRYWDVDSGEILLGDRPLSQIDPQAIRQAISYVTQRVHIFSTSIAENLRLANPKADDAQLWEVLKIVELDQIIRDLPAGLNTRLGSRGTGLSGGQRQRLALARALLKESPVLVLDEFTAHLEPSLAARIRQRVRQQRPEATIIEITHTLSQIKQSDQVLVLAQGKLVQQGEAEKLLQQEGELAKLVAHEEAAQFNLPIEPAPASTQSSRPL